MRLSAQDEGGNEGVSDPVEITLPQRTFVKPLARALVEQRRNLVQLVAGVPGAQRAAEQLLHRQRDRLAPDERWLVLRVLDDALSLDYTEALVSIDVNSGSFRTEDNAEETAYQLNIQAAKEIARQLRLRDLGGRLHQPLEGAATEQREIGASRRRNGELHR